MIAALLGATVTIVTCGVGPGLLIHGQPASVAADEPAHVLVLSERRFGRGDHPGALRLVSGLLEEQPLESDLLQSQLAQLVSKAAYRDLNRSLATQAGLELVSPATPIGSLNPEHFPVLSAPRLAVFGRALVIPPSRDTAARTQFAQSPDAPAGQAGMLTLGGFASLLDQAMVGDRDAINWLRAQSSASGVVGVWSRAGLGHALVRQSERAEQYRGISYFVQVAVEDRLTAPLLAAECLSLAITHLAKIEPAQDIEPIVRYALREFPGHPSHQELIRLLHRQSESKQP